MTRKHLLLLFLVSVHAFGAGRILNVDFGNAAVQGPPVGKAAIGVSDADVWNLSSNPFISDAGIDNLVWADGAASGVNLRITNAPGAWTTPVDNAMFNIYAYNKGGPMSVTLTGLATGTYDIYAYGHGEADSMTTRFEVDAGSGVLPARTTGNSPRWRTLPFEEGAHYVVFRGVAVNEGSLLVILANPDGNATPFLNWIQIVESQPTPVEPLVNIDFGNATVQGPPVGRAAIGNSDTDRWNLYSSPFIANGAITNLVWSDGSSSGASLYVTNAPGAWTVPISDNMFAIYAYSQRGPIEVTVSNLPAGNYSVFAYGHGEQDAYNTRFRILSGDAGHPDQSTGTSARWRTLPFAEGEHYVAFHNVSVRDGTPLIIVANPTTANTPFLNGLQILRAPLPKVTILPNGGFFTNLVEVVLQGGDDGSVLRYTLDGSSPSVNSPLYFEPIKIRTSATLNVRRFRNGEPDSELVSAEFRRVYAIDDGLTAEWRLRYFGPEYLTDPRVGAGEDPDGDGATNLSEFAAGSDPLDPLSGFSSQVGLLPAIEWSSVSRNSYRILRKRNFTDPNWVEVGKVTATGPQSRFVDETSDGQGYLYVVEPVR